MKPCPLTEPGPTFWEDGLLDSRQDTLEAKLTQSIENNLRRSSLPRVQTAAHSNEQPLTQLQSTTLTGLVAGCGVAAIDGYLAIKDYAAAKNLDLAEFHHKGIDLQDLLSTLIINVSQQSTNGQRYKR